MVWRWDSDAFGSTAANEDPDGDGVKVTINLRFPGQYYDQESGLHYNLHRQYAPQTGRYTQGDPIGLAGGMNTFGYARQNPLRYIDPDGLNPLFGAAASGSTGASGFGGLGGFGHPGSFGSGSKDDGSYGGLLPPGTMTGSKGWGKSLTQSAMDECEQECDDALDRDYAYCKALGGMYQDYRTRKACEDRAFAKYVQCRKDCKEKCK